MIWKRQYGLGAVLDQRAEAKLTITNEVLMLFVISITRKAFMPIYITHVSGWWLCPSPTRHWIRHLWELSSPRGEYFFARFILVVISSCLLMTRENQHHLTWSEYWCHSYCCVQYTYILYIANTKQILSPQRGICGQFLWTSIWWLVSLYIRLVHLGQPKIRENCLSQNL